MTDDQKVAWSESQLFRGRCKGQCLLYADEVVREDPYALIPADPVLSYQYHRARVEVSNRALQTPDLFAQQNSASLALMLIDPMTADDLSLKGAVINLWQTLSGGVPVAPPSPPSAPPPPA